MQPDATGLVFIASAESKAALHPNLMATHMFKETVHLQPPGKDERKEVRIITPEACPGFPTYCGIVVIDAYAPCSNPH